jgi:hypothetical protein
LSSPQYLIGYTVSSLQTATTLGGHQSLFAFSCESSGLGLLVKLLLTRGVSAHELRIPATLAGAGSAATAGRITAVSRCRSDTMEVFWIGPNGTVENRNFYDGVGWRGFTLAGPGAASTTGGIAAVSRSSNTIELFYVGADGSIQDANFYEGGPWRGFTLAGPGSAATTSGIAALSRAFYTMEVFWTGPNGTVQDAFWYNGGPWSGFTLSGPGSASTTAGIAAVSRDPRCMGVWWIGPDGHVEDANWNDGSTFDGNPGCERQSLNKQWYAWPLAPAGSASITGGIAAVSRSSNTIELFWIAADGHVQHAWWYPDAPLNQWAQAPLAINASPVSGLAAVSRNFNTMEIWWSGSDRSVQDQYWYSTAWTGGYPHLTSLSLNVGSCSNAHCPMTGPFQSTWTRSSIVS